MTGRGSGQVPDGWEVVRLGDIARERTQRASSAPQAEVFSVTKHHGFVPSLEYFDRQVFSQDTGNYKVVRRGDLAYATIHLDEGSLGILNEADVGLISPMYTVFEPDSDHAASEYLFVLMKLPQMVARYQRIGEGTVDRRKSISFERLGRLRILIPPLPEQRRIVTVLDSIDEAIECTEAVIVVTERLRDALLHELLTRGLPGHHTEWRDVPGLGRVPACWEVVRLGDVMRLGYGVALPERDRRPGRVPVYGSAGRVGWHDEAEIRGPGIVVGRKGSIGSVSWVPEDFVPIDTTYFAAPLDGQADLRWLFHTLTRADLSTLNRATGVPGLNRDDVYALQRPTPPLPEQSAIAAVLDSMDEAIERARDERTVLQSSKASTADALLTGRVRVRRG